MAKQVVEQLVDDLDGGVAHESIRFAFDGVEYEIDLSKRNARDLRKAVTRYIEVARRVPRAALHRPRIAPAGRRRATVDREQNTAIREWARRKGKSISDRGRIPQSIIDEFQARGGR
jgi:hypothetical protein